MRRSGMSLGQAPMGSLLDTRRAKGGGGKGEGVASMGQGV